jgi:hypothetical protein
MAHVNPFAALADDEVSPVSCSPVMTPTPSTPQREVHSPISPAAPVRPDATRHKRWGDLDADDDWDPEEKRQAWADMEDDPIEDFPALVSPGNSFEPPTSSPETDALTSPSKTIERKCEDQPRSPVPSREAMQVLDKELERKREIEITHNVRVFNKETGEFTNQTNTRKLRVMSKRNYEHLRELIDRFKSHRGPNRDRYDHREQQAKIKLTNSLMEMCYKDPDPKHPCTFWYPVVIIHVRNQEGETRVLTRNEVHKGSSCFFECSDIIFQFKPTQSNDTSSDQSLKAGD